MERQGFPRPVFSIERQVKRELQKQFNRILKQMLQDFRQKAEAEGLHIRKSQLTTDGQDNNQDSWDSIREFFQELNELEAASKEAMKEIETKSKINSIAMNLANDWDYDDEEDEIPDLAYEHHLADLLMQNQAQFINRLQNDGPKLDLVVKSFSLDKQKLFDDNMEQLRKLYLDNCRARIQGEENLLKKRFLEALNDYVIGKTAKLDITDITEALYNDSSRMSQFFARDQLARFNKATTLATFAAAGVTKVKWITTHDVRVRESHKALDGQVFSVDALPPEIDDYNCRCGLVPVEWRD